MSPWKAKPTILLTLGLMSAACTEPDYFTTKNTSPYSVDSPAMQFVMVNDSPQTIWPRYQNRSPQVGKSWLTFMDARDNPLTALGCGPCLCGWSEDYCDFQRSCILDSIEPARSQPLSPGQHLTALLRPQVASLNVTRPSSPECFDLIDLRQQDFKVEFCWTKTPASACTTEGSIDHEYNPGCVVTVDIECQQITTRYLDHHTLVFRVQ